jgi:hypothetical protein
MKSLKIESTSGREGTDTTSIALKIPVVPGYVFSDIEDTSFWCLLFIENIYHTYKTKSGHVTALQSW